MSGIDFANTYAAMSKPAVPRMFRIITTVVFTFLPSFQMLHVGPKTQAKSFIDSAIRGWVEGVDSRSFRLRSSILQTAGFQAYQLRPASPG